MSDLHITEEQRADDERNRREAWLRKHAFFDTSWDDATRIAKAGASFRERLDVWREHQCQWQRHQWGDRTSEREGFITTTCAVCGKWLGDRPARLPGTGILPDVEQ